MSAQETLISQIIIKPAKEKHLHISFLPAMFVGVVLGSISLLNTNVTFSYYLIKGLQIILFFAFGNIYTSRNQYSFELKTIKKQASNILFITCSFCVLLSVIYLFFKKDIWLMACSSSAAFILPFCLNLCWYSFTSIPGKMFNAWFPHQVQVSEQTSVFLDSIVVRLKIKQHVSDVDEKIYTVFIHHSTGLGDFYSHFIASHNTHEASLIEDNDAHGSKYAWDFFIHGFFGLTRRLDPDLNIDGNKIKKDAVVYVKRLMRT